MSKREDLENKIKNLMEKGSWEDLQEAINLLEKNTGYNKVFDPYKEPDKLLWNYGMNLFYSGQIMESLSIFQTQLQKYLEVQEKNKTRIHRVYHQLVD